ncbi:NHL repeat-containing protein [Streptomyces sp. HD]|uniref:NHL repeat-containing protein n=1 Tax=Streptomyces sp. HD TaxID=3020892 RepID=UPI00232F386A|nr:NHL repeat-containing protein [Streptomyces sp. HD]MDC0766763.1 NHL repeat-containing protein [Streptomyces sp. HD]
MAGESSTGTGPQPIGLPDGAIATVAGTGATGYLSDGGPAPLTRLYLPMGLAVDRQGNLYIADRYNHRIRKVTPDGIITTVAGTGDGGYVSDGGPAVATRLNEPIDVAVDDAGNVYIADGVNHRIRKVTPAGIITTVAGNGEAGYVSDGGPAIATRLNHPHGIAVDREGNLYFSEWSNHRVRKVSRNGIITTVAGNGTAGYVSDGGPAIATRLQHPSGVAVDPEGNLYIADCVNHRVRKVSRNGIITTVAGNGTAGYVSDGGPAVATRIHHPHDVALDAAGNLYIADSGNHRLRRVSTNGIITTVAGNGIAGYVDDGGPAVSTRLYSPTGVTLDAAGNLYIGDYNNHRVRGVTAVADMTPPLPPAADLYGEIVSPLAVQRGQAFDLGVRIKNRGPNTVDGRFVTVVLSLADGLVGGPGTSDRRLSRTFTGQQLVPNQGSLDGVFRVSAPDTTPPGTYNSTLEIQYSGEINLKDNVERLPVTIVVPAPIGDETALTVIQDTIPTAAPGQRTVLTMKYTSGTGQPVNPGVIVQRFTAPEGFTFSGQPTYAYYETIHGVIAGNLDHSIEDSGRTLVVRANPHLNTTTSDTGSLICTIPVQARTDALPGRYDNGSASIGRLAPVQISGRIGGAESDLTARVTQTKQEQARVRPGQRWVYPAVLQITNTSRRAIGTEQIVLTAPEGMRFTEDRLVLWHEDTGQEVVNAAERSADGRRLTCRQARLDIDPGKRVLLYPEMEVDSFAAPGTVRVGLQVGNPVFAAGQASIVIETP